jgi:zinc transporter ZupT
MINAHAGLLLERTTCATGIAYAGAALGVLPGRFGARHLPLIVYTAMGILLGVTVFDALPDAKALLSWPVFALSVVCGFGVFWLVGRFLAPVCPACALETMDTETAHRLGRSAALLMVALGLHSTMDGVAVVLGNPLTGHTDLALLLAVSVHKLPEGMALTLVLLSAGYSRSGAFFRTIALEATTEIGGILGIFILPHVSPWGLGFVFGSVAGGFLYLAANLLGTFGGHDARSNRPAWSSLPGLTGGIAFGITAALIRVAELYTPS